MEEFITRSNYVADLTESYCNVLFMSNPRGQGYPHNVHFQSFGTKSKAVIAKLQLSGYVLLRYVSPEEFAKRCIWPSTNGTHANKRLRTLRHWQRK